MFYYLYALWNDYHDQFNYNIDHPHTFLYMCVVRIHNIYSQQISGFCYFIITMLYILSPELTSKWNLVKRYITIFIYFKILFYLFWKAELQETKRGRERKVLHSLVHSPSDCYGWGWSRSKLGARNCIQVSHMSSGPKYLSHLPLLFHMH